MALRLIGLTQRYGDQTVLDGVSLHVREGDCYGFLGHNGAGKTTSMRIALGLVRPQSGRVVVDGFDAAEHPLEARARLGGLIETPGFHGHLGGRANLVLLARLQGTPRAAANAEADRLLGVVGLTAAARKPVAAYSQGMRQRLGIAQALLGRPKVVLLDEPLNGLDPEGIEEMRRVLRGLTRDEGTTVLLSSHQLHELSGLCNRVGILKQGRMLLEEETAKLFAAAGDRYVLTADGAADGVIAALGAAGLRAAPRKASDGEIELDLAGRRPSDVLRGLVGAGVAVRTFAPRPASLEEIYLASSASDGAARDAASAEAADVTTSAPKEQRAAPAPVLRALRYDVSRWMSSAAVPIAFTLPAAIAAGRVWLEVTDVAAQQSRVAAGTLSSFTEPTAFTALAQGLRWGMPALAVIAAAFAAQSVAGESASGTLRNVLLRPVGRARLAAGKAAAVLVATGVSYALLVGVAFGAAALAFDFTDVFEVSLNGFRLPLMKADEVWPDVMPALLRPLAGIAAFSLLGFLVGTLARGVAGAMAAAIGVVVAGVVALELVDPQRLPSAHVPWGALRDASAVRRLFDLSVGSSDAQPAGTAGSLWVPVAWGVAAVVVACFAIRRRSVS